MRQRRERKKQEARAVLMKLGGLAFAGEVRRIRLHGEGFPGLKHDQSRKLLDEVEAERAGAAAEAYGQHNPAFWWMIGGCTILLAAAAVAVWVLPPMLVSFYN